MQNTNKVQESQARINAMKYEHVLQELLEKDERLANLEGELADVRTDLWWMREVATVGIHQAHAALRREQRQKGRIAELEALIRELRAELAPDDPRPAAGHHMDAVQ